MYAFTPPAQKPHKGLAPSRPESPSDDPYVSVADAFYPPVAGEKISAYSLMVGDLMFYGVIPDCGRLVAQWLTLKRKLCVEKYVKGMMKHLYDAVGDAAVAVRSGRNNDLELPTAARLAAEAAAEADGFIVEDDDDDGEESEVE